MTLAETCAFSWAGGLELARKTRSEDAMWGVSREVNAGKGPNLATGGGGRYSRDSADVDVRTWLPNHPVRSGGIAPYHHISHNACIPRQC